MQAPSCLCDSHVAMAINARCVHILLTPGRVTLINSVWCRYGKVTDNETGKVMRWELSGRPLFRTGDVIQVEVVTDSLKSLGGSTDEGEVSKVLVLQRRLPPGQESRKRRIVSSPSSAVVHNVLGVVVLYADDGLVPWCDEACVTRLLWDAPNSVRALYLDSSYGHVDFVPTGSSRVETVTIPGTSANKSCPVDEIAYLANTVLTTTLGANVDIYSDFDHITYYLPDNIGCNFGGLAEVGGGYSWMYSSSGPVLAHELGHNLGVYHVHSLHTLNFEYRLALVLLCVCRYGGTRVFWSRAFPSTCSLPRDIKAVDVSRRSGQAPCALTPSAPSTALCFGHRAYISVDRVSFALHAMVHLSGPSQSNVCPNSCRSRCCLLLFCAHGTTYVCLTRLPTCFCFVFVFVFFFFDLRVWHCRHVSLVYRSEQ